MESKQLWVAIGILIVLFLVVTTPGWKEVLGVNLELGKYAPLLVVLGVMGVLLAIAMGGEGGKE